MNLLDFNVFIKVSIGFIILRNFLPTTFLSFTDVSMTFDNGRSFIGEIDPAKLPNGFGKEFYPSGKLFYKGRGRLIRLIGRLTDD